MKTLLMQLRKERLEKKQACRDLSPDLRDTGKCGALINWVSRPLRLVIYPGEMRMCNLFNIFIFILYGTFRRQETCNRMLTVYIIARVPCVEKGGEEKESRGGGLRKETNALDPPVYKYPCAKIFFSSTFRLLSFIKPCAR